MTDIEVTGIETESGLSFQLATNQRHTDPVSQGVREGDYSLPLSVEVLLAGIPRAATVLDLGAHIGTFAVAAAALDYDVVAVEAAPGNVELLRASVQLNGFDNLRVVHAAISDVPGTVPFHENGPWGIVATPRLATSGSIPVATTSVDALAHQLPPGRRIGFVKMDIEGSEFAALEGMRRLLGAPDAPPIFYESNGHTLHLFDKTPAMLIAELAGHGYRSYFVQSKRLVPVGPEYVQYSCVVDNLAAKQLIGDWPDWQADVMTVEEQIERAIAEASAPLPAQRAHTARALRDAPPEVLADAGIQETLASLKGNGDPEVAEAAAWFVPSPESSASDV